MYGRKKVRRIGNQISPQSVDSALEQYRLTMTAHQKEGKAREMEGRTIWPMCSLLLFKYTSTIIHNDSLLY